MSEKKTTTKKTTPKKTTTKKTTPKKTTTKKKPIVETFYKDAIDYNELKEHYKKLDAPYSEKQLKKVNELKEHFAKKISDSRTSMSDALPIIDLTQMMITEYQSVYGWIDEAYYKFIFKGSRGSAKTTFAVQFIIIDMLIDPQANWFVIMENKVQHSDTTMLEFKEWIDKIDEKWLGFANKWEKSDGQSIKEWRFRHNGNYQKIKFIGLDEAGKGTITPPAGGYWKGFWVEEVVSSNEQFGADMEKKKEKFDVLNTLKASSIRFFNRCKDKEKQNKLRFLEFWTFNPYNDEEPALEKFNKFLPDNFEKLSIYGWDYYKNEEDKEVYITSNYLVNQHLPEEFIRLMERTAKEQTGAWKTIVYGITGSPINTVYSDVMHIIDKNNQIVPRYNQIGYTGFSDFAILLDVGNGGEGQMALGLMGRKLDGTWLPLREWSSKKYVEKNGFDSEKLAIAMWNIIRKWNKEYADFGKPKLIPIIMDNDPHFKVVFEKAFKVIDTNWKNKFKIHLFTEKHLKGWKNEKRPLPIKHLITTGYWTIYKQLTPMYYSQLKSTKTNKNSGKILDGNDDIRQMFELGLFFVAREIGMYEFQNKKVMDKDMKEFILSIT